MATNNIIGSYDNIVINSVYPQFTNVASGTINLQNIQHGQYMLKLKDYSPYTNALKIEKMTLNQSFSGTNSLNNKTIIIEQNAKKLIVTGLTPFNFSIYSLDGKTEVSAYHFLKQSHMLNSGEYLLHINSSNKNTIRKIVIY